MNSLTPEALKRLKLKFVIIYDHILYSFTICLSGQNKAVRKKYWNMFRESDWKKYHIAESIENSLMIIDYVLVEKPDLKDLKSLTLQIEKESILFMNELIKILE